MNFLFFRILVEFRILDNLLDAHQERSDWHEAVFLTMVHFTFDVKRHAVYRRHCKNQRLCEVRERICEILRIDGIVLLVSGRLRNFLIPEGNVVEFYHILFTASDIPLSPLLLLAHVKSHDVEEALSDIFERGHLAIVVFDHPAISVLVRPI